MKVYLLYKTDIWHTSDSKELIGVATSPAAVIEMCKEFAKKEGEIISEDDLYNLEHIKQTQNYQGEAAGEFLYEEIETNVLL
jgi:hypothetical protein